MAILIVLVTMVAGAAIYVFAARRSPEGGREHKTPTSVYAVTAGAMSLLIAFTMSLTFQQFTNAQSAASQDAEGVMAMSRAATLMPANVRDPLRNQLVCYAEEVLNVSWPAMRRGDTDLQPAVRETLATMDGIVAAHVGEVGAVLSIWSSASSDRMKAHIQAMQIAGSGVPPILWMLLIIGSVITIGSLVVYADSSKPAWGHVAVIIGPLFVASAALVVIAFFDHPYADTPGAVSPVAMERVLTRLTKDHVLGVPPAHCPHEVPVAQG
jgi:hypothetical protein